jgi:hypothetical protein
MNSELKRAIYRKKMLYNKFQKYNNSKNWEASCFVIKTSFSDKTVFFWFTFPLFVKKGLTVGQKSLDLGPPAHLGNNQINVDGDHPSILEIKNNHPELLENSFSFSSIYPDFVEKRINKINVRKATGIDGISPKLLHFAKPIIVKPLTDIVNLSISTSTFPDRLKEAQVAPIHKKNSVLEKGNYRPVSVLPAIMREAVKGF